MAQLRIFVGLTPKERDVAKRLMWVIGCMVRHCDRRLAIGNYRAAGAIANNPARRGAPPPGVPRLRDVALTDILES